MANFEGMRVVFQVGEESEMPETPGGFPTCASTPYDIAGRIRFAGSGGNSSGSEGEEEKGNGREEEKEDDDENEADNNKKGGSQQESEESDSNEKEGVRKNSKPDHARILD